MYDICRKCGRRLTEKKSMERGYGPTCWSRIGNVNESRPAKPEEKGMPYRQMSIYDFPEFLPERNDYGGKRKKHSKDSAAK